VRQFDAQYLDETRAGMWDDSRTALDALALDSRDRVLDVGCGTGVLTRVLREEVSGTVIGLDADRRLLERLPEPVLQGDGTRLPVRDDAVDLVVCQALLINLSDPGSAIDAFARASSDLVAAIEPDNSAVTITSSVDAEAHLAQQARELYIEGVDTDVTLGGNAATLFEEAGLDVIATARYDHEQLIEPPYSEAALEGARKKVRATRIDETRRTLDAGDASPEAIDALRSAWRTMGRDVIRQMQTDEYRRREVVPFYVTVGRVPE
jgi:SAM-dependent methyltransferase